MTPPARPDALVPVVVEDDEDGDDPVPPERIRARARRDREMLAVATLVVAFAFALQVRPDGRVAFRGFEGVALPESCMSQVMWRQKCPGCGLTRSIIRLARGDVAGSVRFHRFGWLMAFAILLQFPYRLYCHLTPDRRPLGTLAPTVFGLVLIAALLGNWVAEVLGY